MKTSVRKESAMKRSLVLLTVSIVFVGLTAWADNMDGTDNDNGAKRSNRERARQDSGQTGQGNQGVWPGRGETARPRGSETDSVDRGGQRRQGDAGSKEKPVKRRSGR